MEPNPEADNLIQRFHFQKLLNQDSAGRRIALQGSIDQKAAIVLVERAVFDIEQESLHRLLSTLQKLEEIGHNDIYWWFNAVNGAQRTDLKINVIWPCTEKHIRKYTAQSQRVFTEDSQTYRTKVRPFIEAQRASGRMDWVFNIIEGRAEQDKVFYRERGQEGFLITPDLNWDGQTLSSLHVLALVERRDLWSVRDLKKKHIIWLRHMCTRLREATVKLYPSLEEDQLKLYVHYPPTYWHLHIHVVNVALEAGGTQAVGKALSLENIIAQLETMQGNDEIGMGNVSLTYTIGTESELWTEVLRAR